MCFALGVARCCIASASCLHCLGGQGPGTTKASILMWWSARNEKGVATSGSCMRCKKVLLKLLRSNRHAYTSLGKLCQACRVDTPELLAIADKKVREDLLHGRAKSVEQEKAGSSVIKAADIFSPMGQVLANVRAVGNTEVSQNTKNSLTVRGADMDVVPQERFKAFTRYTFDNYPHDLNIITVPYGTLQ